MQIGRSFHFEQFVCCLTPPAGPLCAVCARTGGDYGTGYARSGTKCTQCSHFLVNLILTSMLPFGIVLLGFWVAQRKITAVNPRAPLVRIVLTHFQVGAMACLCGRGECEGRRVVVVLRCLLAERCRHVRTLL